MTQDIICDIRYGNLNSDTGNTSVTLSRGTSPSIFTFETDQPENRVASVQDVIITENGQTVAEFKDCAIDQVFRGSDPDKPLIYTVQIKDRRWMWWEGGGYVVGRYNVRTAKGEIEEDTKKKPKELFEIVLDALGEKNYELKVPEDVIDEGLPEIEWDYKQSVAALQELLDHFACVLVLSTKNKIKVLQDGIKLGSGLPSGYVIQEGETISSVAYPDEVEFVGGQITYQGLLELEPVGLDLDDAYKLWDEISYKPDGDDGFENYAPQSPEQGVTYGDDDEEREKAQSLAKQTIWKTYRIRRQATGGDFVPTYGQAEREMYVVIKEIYDGAENPDGGHSKLEPYVTGQWYSSDLGIEEEDTVPAGSVRLNTKYDGSFQIDTENSLVKFSAPVFNINKEDNWEAPRLFLYCAYYLKDPDNGVAERYTRSKKLSNKSRGVGAAIVRNDDVFRLIRIKHRHLADPDDGSRFIVQEVDDDKDKMDKIADFYLAQKVKELQIDSGRDVTYDGFQKIELDGVVQQVSWYMQDGKGFTRASENSEHATFTPRRKIRKRSEDVAIQKDEIQQVKNREKRPNRYPK